MLIKGGDYVAKLTDRQRKRIIAEYVNGDGKISQRQLAEKYGVSRQAISKILNTTEGSERLQQQKEQNTLSMIEYLNDQKNKAQSLISKILDAATDDIEEAPLRDKMGALKILSEVFAGKSEETAKNSGSVAVNISIEDCSGGKDGQST